MLDCHLCRMQIEEVKEIGRRIKKLGLAEGVKNIWSTNIDQGGNKYFVGGKLATAICLLKAWRKRRY